MSDYAGGLVIPTATFALIQRGRDLRVFDPTTAPKAMSEAWLHTGAVLATRKALAQEARVRLVNQFGRFTTLS